MSSAIVYTVLAFLIAMLSTSLVVVNVMNGMPAALTILIVGAGVFTTAVCLINAHYAH